MNITQKEDLPLHSTKNLYLTKMPCEKLDYVKEIYRELNAPDLLSQCLKGATQNANVPTQQELE